MENIVDYITNLCKEKYPNYPDPTDNELHEFIVDMEKVWSGDHDQHRWYTIYFSVYKLPCGRYVKIPRIICDENQGYYECLQFNKEEDIVEVFPKEVTTTIYLTEEEMNKS